MPQDTLRDAVDYVKPLSIAIAGMAMCDVNEALSTFALCLSISYSIYKLYKEKIK